LGETELDELDGMYREELAKVFGIQDLEKAVLSDILSKTEPLAKEGRGKGLRDQFVTFQRERKNNDTISSRSRIEKMSLAKARTIIQSETDALFLDKVVLKIHNDSIPSDVILVDLPGVSVPNPRHRRITFKFIKEEAHAVVFVLLAPQIFNKDDHEIMEEIRKGGNSIAEKTFWVINRWDSLSPGQQTQTLSDFGNVMKEYSIPGTYSCFQTNALYGLLSQLRMKGDVPNDTALAIHLQSYEKALLSRYSGDHKAALHDSQVDLLQAKTLDFLNNRLRETTLKATSDSINNNFYKPIRDHLIRSREKDESTIKNELSNKQKDVVRTTVKERFDGQTKTIRDQIQTLMKEFVQHGTMLEPFKKLEKDIQEKISDGKDTDAYEVYTQILAHGKYRQVPYYLEIELKVVENLNTVLKEFFVNLVKDQTTTMFNNLTDRINGTLEKIREEVNNDKDVVEPLEKVLVNARSSFQDRVFGVAIIYSAELDKLLTYERKTFGFGGNNLLNQLENVARSDCTNIQDCSHEIKSEHFKAKTDSIRNVLKKEYLKKIAESHGQIIQKIFPVITNCLQEVEENILREMGTKYSSALDTIVRNEIEGTFSLQKKELETRSQRFRGIIEKIDQTHKEMMTSLANVI